MGSVRTLTDSAGAAVNGYDYLPFGGAHQPGTSVTVEQRYTYTGRERNPESALMYYRYRQYDPRIGRFGGRDPIGYRGDVVLYGYAAGRPTVYADPLALKPADRYCKLTHSGRDVSDSDYDLVYRVLWWDEWSLSYSAKVTRYGVLLEAMAFGQYYAFGTMDSGFAQISYTCTVGCECAEEQDDLCNIKCEISADCNTDRMQDSEGPVVAIAQSSVTINDDKTRAVINVGLAASYGSPATQVAATGSGGAFVVNLGGSKRAIGTAAQFTFDCKGKR